MRIIDRKFYRHKFTYVFQCCLAGISALVVLAIFNSISNEAIVAALGASIFIALVLPETKSSEPRYMVGGYLVGVAVGSMCYWLNRAVYLPERIGLICDVPYVVFGALAVGLATFVMVVTDTEHPPAAGIALGLLMLDKWTWAAPLGALAAVVVLCLLKRALKPIIHNLL